MEDQFLMIYNNESFSFGNNSEKDLDLQSNATTTVDNKFATLSGSPGSGFLQIPLYSLILMLAIVGNLLVISTLVQNRRMRTITNLFLLNLAVSDILLGVVCMPVTLVGTILRRFIFGEILCKLIPFMQATLVAVSSWTLVAISCERYYAICHPLRSLSWQTLRHAYKIIIFIWTGSFVCMSPIVLFSKLIPMSQGYHKCREAWPGSSVYERTYNIFLDIILLIGPLIILCLAYYRITRTLYRGIYGGKMSENESKAIYRISGDNLAKTFRSSSVNEFLECGGTSSAQVYPEIKIAKFFRTQSSQGLGMEKKGGKSNHEAFPKYNKKASSISLFDKQIDSILRRTNVAKNFESKKRVVKMLFVLVLEFFICWTPLYVINTITLFDPTLVYQNVGYTAISFFQLLAYSSSCCNPITYCFMNASFRKAFLDTFNGLRKLIQRSKLNRKSARPSK